MGTTEKRSPREREMDKLRLSMCIAGLILAGTWWIAEWRWHRRLELRLPNDQVEALLADANETWPGTAHALFFDPTPTTEGATERRTRKNAFRFACTRSTSTCVNERPEAIRWEGGQTVEVWVGIGAGQSDAFPAPPLRETDCRLLAERAAVENGFFGETNPPRFLRASPQGGCLWRLP